MSPMQAQFSTLIRLPEVIRITGLKRSSIYARIDRKSRYFDPTFPLPVHLSPTGKGSVAWPLAEVVGWVEQRIAASRNRSAA